MDEKGNELRFITYEIAASLQQRCPINEIPLFKTIT
jgi:hypothetical protein